MSDSIPTLCKLCEQPTEGRRARVLCNDCGAAFVSVAAHQPNDPVTLQLQKTRLIVGLEPVKNPTSDFAWAHEIAGANQPLTAIVESELQNRRREEEQQRFLAASSAGAIERKTETEKIALGGVRNSSATTTPAQQYLKSFRARLRLARPAAGLRPKEAGVEAELVLVVRRLSLVRTLASGTAILVVFVAFFTSSGPLLAIAAMFLIVRVFLTHRLNELEDAVASLREFTNPRNPELGDFISMQLFAGPVVSYGRHVGRVLRFDSEAGTAEIVSEATPRTSRLPSGRNIGWGDHVRFTLRDGIAAIIGTV